MRLRRPHLNRRHLHQRSQNHHLQLSNVDRSRLVHHPHSHVLPMLCHLGRRLDRRTGLSQHHQLLNEAVVATQVAPMTDLVDLIDLAIIDLVHEIIRPGGVERERLSEIPTTEDQVEVHQGRIERRETTERLHVRQQMFVILVTILTSRRDVIIHHSRPMMVVHRMILDLVNAPMETWDLLLHKVLIQIDLAGSILHCQVVAPNKVPSQRQPHLNQIHRQHSRRHNIKRILRGLP